MKEMEYYTQFTKALEWLIFILFAIIVGSATLGVLSRAISFIPTIIWTDEISRYSMVVAVFLVAGIAMKRGVHLGVTFVIEKLPQKYSNRLILFNNLLISLFLLIIVYISFQLALDNMSQTTVTLDIPIGIPFMAIPIGLTLVIIEIVRSSYLILRRNGQ